MHYQEDTQVFVLTTQEKRFACLVELATGRHWAYAFTSPGKAEDFLRITRLHEPLKNAQRLFPCTLKEWFDWQPKKNLPDLAIDPDPRQLRDYPLHLQADLSTHDLQCITRQSAHGKTYEVLIHPRRESKPSRSTQP